jgi:hypothetical protein
MANVISYPDYAEQQQQQQRDKADVAPEIMSQLPPLIDDEDEDDAEQEDSSQPPPSSIKDQEDSVREAHVVLDAFMQRFRFNSMWKVIKQRLSQDDPPFDDPALLSFWMVATLAPAAWVRGDVDKLRMLRERRWEVRLKQAVVLFKKYPPVRNTLAQSSDAAHLWDRDSAFSLAGLHGDDESDAPTTPSNISASLPVVVFRRVSACARCKC